MKAFRILTLVSILSSWSVHIFEVCDNDGHQFLPAFNFCSCVKQ